MGKSSNYNSKEKIAPLKLLLFIKTSKNQVLQTTNRSQSIPGP